jgi:hypothetical protein
VVLERLELFVHYGPVRIKIKWSVPTNEHTHNNTLLQTRVFKGYDYINEMSKLVQQFTVAYLLFYFEPITNSKQRAQLFYFTMRRDCRKVNELF